MDYASVVSFKTVSNKRSSSIQVSISASSSGMDCTGVRSHKHANVSHALGVCGRTKNSPMAKVAARPAAHAYRPNPPPCFNSGSVGADEARFQMASCCCLKNPSGVLYGVFFWGMVYVNWTKRSAKGLIGAGSQVGLDFVLGMKIRGLCSPF